MNNFVVITFGAGPYLFYLLCFQQLIMEHFSGLFEVLFIVLQDDQVSLVISVAEKKI